MDKIHPGHYAPVRFCDGPEGFFVDPFWYIKPCSVCLGSALKYLWRAGKKAGESEKDDLQKALFYLNGCIEDGVFAPLFRDDLQEKLELLCGANKYWDALFSHGRYAAVALIKRRLEELE